MSWVLEYVFGARLLPSQHTSLAETGSYRFFLLRGKKIPVISKSYDLPGFFQLLSELIPLCLLTEGTPRAGSGAEGGQ